MLQINSGKLYSTGVGRTNRLRGILYSNLQISRDEPIITAAGTLLGTDMLRGNRALVYDIEERIQDGPDGPGVLVSHGVDPFLIDFAAVASFWFNAVVSPDLTTVEQMLSERPSLAAYASPKQFLRRCFDDRLWVQAADAAGFVTFVDDLIGLERRAFLAAMRAMRTYVAGVHRLRDDLGVAYTLMVSAVESLVQRFDGFETNWSDVDEAKRRALDAALKRASKRTADLVRAAIIANEHASLGRRYRAFVMSHVDDFYFRDPMLAGRPMPLARYEMDEALKQAYVIRSKYLHNLKPLPDDLTHPFDHWEIIYVARQATLTFEGLARLTRQVIREFVRRGSKVEKETYAYRSEEAGIRIMELSPEYWIGRPIINAGEGRKRFEGLLSQLVGVMKGLEGASLTDLRTALASVERLVPHAGAERKSTLLALYGLFNSIIAPELRMPKFRKFLDEHEAAIVRPSPETLVAFTIVGELETWDIETHRELLEIYFAKRATTSGLKAPRLFEAAMCLALAERYRLVQKLEGTKAFISKAVEAYPGTTALVDFEGQFDPDVVIDWRAILLPSTDGGLQQSD